MVAQTDVPVNAFGKILSRAGENNSHALLGKQGICIYKRSNLRFPALPETVILLVGKHPKPFEQRFTLAAALRALSFFKKRGTMKTQKAPERRAAADANLRKRGLGAVPPTSKTGGFRSGGNLPFFASVATDALLAK